MVATARTAAAITPTRARFIVCSLKIKSVAPRVLEATQTEQRRYHDGSLRSPRVFSAGPRPYCSMPGPLCPHQTRHTGCTCTEYVETPRIDRSGKAPRVRLGGICGDLFAPWPSQMIHRVG